MPRFMLDTSFTAALAAIVLGTLSGVLTASLNEPWVPPVVAGITALAALIRKSGGVADAP